MSGHVLKGIGVAVIVLLLAVAYNMYSSSVENDFKDISNAKKIYVENGTYTYM